mgnify:CR=1 FL=1
MEEEKKMPEKLQVEEKVIEMLKTVYDPEIPVNVYDLGLIYKIDLADADGSGLSGCGFHRGGRASEAGEHRASKVGGGQSGV